MGCHWESSGEPTACGEAGSSWLLLSPGRPAQSVMDRTGGAWLAASARPGAPLGVLGEGSPQRMPGQARRNPGQAGAQLWPELEDDVHGGLGDLPEPTEADVAGQLAYR